MPFLFFILPYICIGQIINYVNNGGFELLNPGAGPYSFESTKFWGAMDTTKASNVLCSTSSSIANAPNLSTGFQYPRTGNNFVGATFYCGGISCNVNNYRMNPRNRLKQPLEAGKTYCAKYYIVNTNNCPFAIDSYGMYFGNSTLDTIHYCLNILSYLIPQIQNTSGIISDTLNWTPITGTFVANGTEKYLVLGNFKSNALTNTIIINPTYSIQANTDIYIDDVSVIDIDLPAKAGADVWGIPTQTVYLGRPCDVGIDEACMWYKLPNTTTAIDTAAGITITVAASTETYMVKQTICGNIKYDTVIVYASGVGLTEQELLANSINLYPNPVMDALTISLSAKMMNSFNHAAIYNALGQILREEEIIFKEGATSINTTHLANGVYILNLRTTNAIGINKRFVISH